MNGPGLTGEITRECELLGKGFFALARIDICYASVCNITYALVQLIHETNQRRILNWMEACCLTSVCQSRTFNF